MAHLTRLYTFTDGQKAYSAQVNAELNQLVAGFNTHDDALAAVIAESAASTAALLEVPWSADIKGIRLNEDNGIEVTLNETDWFSAASSGHIILDVNDNQMPQRSRLKFGGQITVTDDGTHTIINGLKGDTGETGATGNTGPQGEQGIQGPTGLVITPETDPVTGIVTWSLQQDPGVPQPVNIRGPQGPQGVQGSQGPQGVQGIQGATGVQGPTGATGAKGDDGADGSGFVILALYATLAALQIAHPTGTAGQAYAVGTPSNNNIYIWSIVTGAWQDIGQITGPQGPQGIQGVTGSQGIQGEIGPQGIQGQQGIQGLQGLKGDTGAQGPAGANGLTTSVNGKTQVAGAITLNLVDIPVTAELDMGAHTIGGTEYDNGNSGTAKTIDWKLGNHQKVTLTGNCTFTFVAPTKPCMLSLRCVNDGTAGRTKTFPTLKKPGGVAFVFTTAANAVDIISLYYDGSSYHAQVMLDSK